MTWWRGSGRSGAAAPAARRPEPLGLLAEAGRNAVRAAELFEQTMRLWPDSRNLVAELRDCEQEGDRITHDLLRVLRHQLAGRLDRREVHQLAIGVDDVVDFVEEAADHLQLYRIEAPMEQAQALAGTLRDAARVLGRALERLDRLDDVMAAADELHRLELEGDRRVRDGIAALFDRAVDPIFVLGWKDVYERVENAIDACDAVGHVLTGIAVRTRNA